MKIEVGYILSYDYSMFLTSVKQLYEYVDKIVVGIDVDFKTWSGNSFEIPDSFFDEVKIFDRRNIIEFYFDSFYIPTLSPMECESRERNLVLKKLGRGWKIQLDVDEYIYDFKEVAKYLNKYWYLNILPNKTPVCIKGKLITLYRELHDGYLFIDNNEQFPFITNQTFNTHTRRNDNIKNYFSNIKVIHQSWARKEEEIMLKINNWGHRDDFDTQTYFLFWKSLTSSNYQEYKNIHPLIPKVWNELYFLPSKSIDDFICKFSNNNNQSLIDLPLIQIIKGIIKKMIGRI
ncbi:hypothetical protein KHA90_12780 [Flavobacterium psychroterrae]|uniref:Glycosyl transferase n=1 Tax=Flavobacterium psychroterrae TaxID=2133767 RepID=A0ABS5PC70_9FLAO|nr:hypothetical protein [Flavobacterium psychroterrae]MBS7231899.1 hypothetical protein [Flavobacterium psychroterrae]